MVQSWSEMTPSAQITNQREIIGLIRDSQTKTALLSRLNLNTNKTLKDALPYALQLWQLAYNPTAAKFFLETFEGVSLSGSAGNSKYNLEFSSYVKQHLNFKAMSLSIVSDTAYYQHNIRESERSIQANGIEQRKLQSEIKILEEDGQKTTRKLNFKMGFNITDADRKEWIEHSEFKLVIKEIQNQIQKLNSDFFFSDSKKAKAKLIETALNTAIDKALQTESLPSLRDDGDTTPPKKEFATLDEFLSYKKTSATSPYLSLTNTGPKIYSIKEALAHRRNPKLDYFFQPKDHKPDSQDAVDKVVEQYKNSVPTSSK